MRSNCGFVMFAFRLKECYTEMIRQRGCITGSASSQVASCAGSLVRALVQSGAHNYVEFKLLQGR